jgi:hypothetical protein
VPRRAARTDFHTPPGTQADGQRVQEQHRRTARNARSRRQSGFPRPTGYLHWLYPASGRTQTWRILDLLLDTQILTRSQSSPVTCANGQPAASAVPRRPRPLRPVPRGLASDGGKVEGNPGRHTTRTPHRCGQQRRFEPMAGHRPDPRNRHVQQEQKCQSGWCLSVAWASSLIPHRRLGACRRVQVAREPSGHYQTVTRRG